MAEALVEREERVKALGHSLPAAILEIILSFEPYPIHPVAALVKTLAFSWRIEQWYDGPVITLLVMPPSGAWFLPMLFSGPEPRALILCPRGGSNCFGIE